MKIPKHLTRLLVFAALVTVVCGPAASQNAVPLLVNYQGELRSPSTGQPLGDGSYEMRFRMYDAESAGNLLWTGNYSSLYGDPVEVKNGLFHVILGSGEGNELDTSIFSGAERWLDIRVGMETLSPRQRITSAAYSIISENTRLLSGKQSSEFAGTTHSHLGSDIASGTVAEARIDPLITRDTEKDAAVTAHAAISNAHHARYTDAEAVAAMGAKSPNNPLNHDKTTKFTELTDVAADAQIPASIARDSEIMPTVLANDGPGSGLSADTVDGMDGAALEESAEIDSDIAAHAAVANAHHTRYTDGEAVAAMGAKANTNPLNHDKTTSFSELTDTASDSQIPAAVARDTEVTTKISDHAAIASAHHTKTTSFADLTDVASDTQIPGVIARDSEIMPTVLANDGAGSGLSADYLDGQDSAAFVTLLGDYGRSGVSSDLYEGTTALTDKYVNVSGDAMTGNLTVSGTVGIGTTSPATKLQVSGGAVSVYKDDGVTNGDHELARFERNELTGYPGIRLGYRANGTSVTGAFLREGGVGGDLEFGTGGFPQAMIIKNSGNVGVGTTSPNAKLEVVSTPGQDSVQINQGEVRTNNAAASTSRYVAAVGGVGYWGLGKTNTGNNDFHIINYPNSRWDLTIRGDTGNVGVGTTSPQEKLDVNGNARVAGDLTVVGTATLGGVTMGKIYLATSGTILSTDGGTRVLSWDATNSEIELTNTSGDWCDYWWQAQKGATTSGNSGATATGTSNVAIISGTNSNDYGFEIHFGQADSTEGWCSVWLQYANGALVGHYIKY